MTTCLFFFNLSRYPIKSGAGYLAKCNFTDALSANNRKYFYRRGNEYFYNKAGMAIVNRYFG